MAKQLKLAAQVRTSAGRSAVKKIKQQGLVPAVIYGAKQQPENLQINAREIQNLLSHATGEHLLVELEIAGSQSGNRLALIQEVQHDPVRGSVLHVDFHAVSADEKIHAEVPVEPVGEAVGVKAQGGILEILLHSVELECVPRDLPEVVRIDVSGLNVNDAIHVRDLQLPAGVTVRGDQDVTVVRLAPPTVSEAPAAGAEAAK
ncbi:MAG: 50S ribosomal protein L25 [Verrucomicrobiaceae bacterium]|nr:MAG: 50S ribosomal protein L25 [Verrucomicrobiaceae bacterium]